MTGMIKRLKLYGSMMRYGIAHNRDFAKENYAFFASMQNYLQRYGVDFQGARVLDVGCGKSYWLTLLLHSAGAQVTGIDTELTEPGRTLGKYLKVLRRNGWERALRTLVWDYGFGRDYYNALQKLCPFPLNFKGVDLRRMSITELEYPDDTFDLVVSHEVFEHIDDIPGAARELRRVINPQGLTFIYVHNFASVSGGHSIAWKYPDTEPSAQVPPWDHLRQNLFPDIPSWINRLRERDYRHAFEPYFDILDWFPQGREGESLLTPEIEAELQEFDRDELLTKGFVIVARPLLQTTASPVAESTVEVASS